MSDYVRVSRAIRAATLYRKRVNWVTWPFDGHYLISNYVIQLRLTVIPEAMMKRRLSVRHGARRSAREEIASRGDARLLRATRDAPSFSLFGNGPTKIRYRENYLVKPRWKFLHLARNANSQNYLALSRRAPPCNYSGIHFCSDKRASISPC